MFFEGLCKEAEKVLGEDWRFYSSEERSSVVNWWEVAVRTGYTRRWKGDDRILALERVLEYALEQLKGAVVYARSADKRADQLADLACRLWSEIKALRERVEDLERAVRDLQRYAGLAASLEDRLRRVSEELDSLEREVAAELVARGVQSTPLVSRYVEWFAREMLQAARGLEELIRELADPTAPLGSPLRRVTPQHAASALRLLAAQREAPLSEEDEREARRLAALGLLKRLPDGSYAPTKFLKRLCAAAASLTLSDTKRTEQTGRTGAPAGI